MLSTPQSRRARIWRQFAEYLANSATGISDIEERFRRVCGSYVQFAIEREHEFRLLFEAEKRIDANNPDSPDDFASWKTLVCLVEEIMPGQGPDLVLQHAHWIWSSLHGLTMLHLSGRLIFDRSLGELAGKIIDAHIQAARHATGGRYLPPATN